MRGTYYAEVDDSEPGADMGMVGDVYQVVSPDGVLVRRTHATRCDMPLPTQLRILSSLVLSLRVLCARERVRPADSSL
jgi:hypothetical protein|eukprot:COSAG01_NODE_6607_length_3583_cov_8.029564_2_plen_78_part_00